MTQGRVVRSIGTTAIALVMGVAAAGVAHAADIGVNVKNSSNSILASGEYVDDGDTFLLWDHYADGKAPILRLQEIYGGGWRTIKSTTNRNGANGHPTGFDYNVSNSVYRMELCVGSKCAYSPSFGE
jgi:hypothetical protein